MDFKQLYNIDDDILITIYPENCSLEVSCDFVQRYQLDVASFCLLNILFVAKKGQASYDEIKFCFNISGLNPPSEQYIDELASSLTDQLATYNVHNLAILVKNKGYKIGPKWKEPINLKKNGHKQKLLGFFKKLCTSYNNMDNKS